MLVSVVATPCEILKSPKNFKNKKSATTYMLEVHEIMAVVRKWDAFVRSILPADAYWFAPLSPITGKIESAPRKANENRSSLFRKNLKVWLHRHHVQLHLPHDFRRGHANFLFDRAKDISDLDAAKENLMHSSLTTTEIYARKRKAQIKNRIRNMSKPKANDTNYDLDARLARIEGALTQIPPLVKEQK